jgi:hypothetical protein
MVCLGCLFTPAGLTLPTERWKEILDEANAKTRKLEEDYEQLCIEKKVSFLTTRLFCSIVKLKHSLIAAGRVVATLLQLN